MEIEFNNLDYIKNISDDASRIASVKLQRNLAIIGCVVIAGIIVVAIVIADQEEQKKAALAADLSNPTSAKVTIASNEIAPSVEQRPDEPANSSHYPLRESWNNMVITH